MVDEYVVVWEELHLANWATLVALLVVAVAILENISDCNGGAWARVIRNKILREKSEISMDENGNENEKKEA